MLKIENLEVYYGGVHALKGISLDVPDNKIITLLGANGAGKSTTLRSICGLVKIHTGKITLEEGNFELSKMATKDIIRAGVAMIPEGRRIFGSLSVRENLSMGAWNRKDKDGIESDIERVFSLFPVLKERFDQKAITLSGGEQQMLSVSRALMARPRLLLMDEPSLGIAPMLVAQMFESVSKFQKEMKMTVVLVEQNMRAAIKIADYGYVLETGTLTIQGTAAELGNNKAVQEAYLG